MGLSTYVISSRDLFLVSNLLKRYTTALKANNNTAKISIKPNLPIITNPITTIKDEAATVSLLIPLVIP